MGTARNARLCPLYGSSSTAPHLRGYRRKARDRFLRVVEVFAFEEGRIDHGKNGRHDRKSYYAPHVAYLVRLSPSPAQGGRAWSIPGICKLFSWVAAPERLFGWNKLRTL